MDTMDIKKRYHNICKLIYRRRLADALVMLRLYVQDSGREYLINELDKLGETYEQLLTHKIRGMDDPERDKIYHYLMRSMLEMTDSLHETLSRDKKGGMIAQLKKQLPVLKAAGQNKSMGILESLTFDDALAGLLRDVNVGDSDRKTSREDSLGKLFHIIWLSDNYGEEEINLLQSVLKSDKLPWHDKSLAVSALTLSLLRYFDVNKFILLFDFAQAREESVWERALTGLFLSFMKYNERYSLYPVLAEKARALQSIQDIELHTEAIIIQFTKSRETEKVKKKWEQEILPAMLKMRPRIEEKLDLNNIFFDNPDEEKNPDWETVFEDAPDLLDKLQELTEMQMDGMDVFISAFSQLKHFPFFRQISNWFIPFYAENPSISSAVDPAPDAPDMQPLIEKLEHTFFMCNSDKYSFCLNLELIPQQQKTMMMNMLSMEMESMSEISKGEELINSLARSRSVYTQYFQDLYRFFKLHPLKGEFDDVFLFEADLEENDFVKQLIPGGHINRNIAEFFLERGFYEDALKVFLTIIEKDKSNIELFEKIAFCHEKTGNFNEAFGFYRKADLIESGRLWIVKKLAYCCKYLNRWPEALNYYLEAEKLDAEDMKIQANIGQCLIHLERYEEALDYYFKVEVLAPENHRIRRPLAWCSFLLGKFDTAQDYLERLLEAEPGNRYDLMNTGHVLWCRNQPAAAASSYIQSVLSWKNLAEFETSFNDDRKHLNAHGIKHDDMNMMLDFVKIEVRKKKNISQ